MSIRKLSLRTWACLACVAALTLYLLASRERGDVRPVAAHIEAQRDLLEAQGFHSDSAGNAIGEYTAAIRVLQEHGWTRERLREYRSATAPLPEAESMESLEAVASLVTRGAAKRDLGVARVPMFRTKARGSAEAIDLHDLTLVPAAAMITARSRLHRDDRDGAARLATAVFAMGLHLTDVDNDVLSAAGIVYRQKALRFLKAIALGDDGHGSARDYEVILATLENELDGHKRGGRRPGATEVIDYLRDKRGSPPASTGE